MTDATSLIPGSARDLLDADALTALLARRHPGVRVRSVEIVDEREVTNAHAWLQVTYDEPAGVPERMFCKLLPGGDRRATIASGGMGLRETYFYQRLAPLLQLRVPAAYAAEVDDEDGRFVLLLEDLEVSGCHISDGTVGVPPDAAARALEDLAELHVRYEDERRREEETPWIERAARPRSDFGARLLRVGLDRYPERVRPAFREIAELYIADPDPLHALWGHGRRTVIHGDAHLGNVFTDGDRVGFYDWGMIAVGTPLRDVSYFLTMSLDVEARRANEAGLWRHYLEVRSALGGSPIDFDEAWLQHRVQAAYNVVASCQVVSSPEDAPERRKIFAGAFLERAQSSVEDLESRAALRELGV